MAASTLPDSKTSDSKTSDSKTVADESDKPDQRRTIIRSIAVTFCIMFIGVSIPLSLFMESWVGGFAVGFFTALWGGPGFGLMAGMALYNLHLENWEKRHPHAAHSAAH